MNLGQLIGELRMQIEDASATPSGHAATPAPRRRGTPRVDRRAQIVALAKERGSVSVRDLVVELGITYGNASVMLFAMHRDGHLLRDGEPHHYLYRVAG